VIYGECIGILTIHKADGEKIPLTEQERMSRFTDLISGAVYNSILFRDSQLAKEKAEESFQKANTLNDMIQVIIQSKSTDEIFTKIYDLFSAKYGLTSYIVYTYDNKDELLKLYKLYGDVESVKEYLKILYRNHFSVNDRDSVQAACFNSKKSFLMKVVKLPHKYKPEEENIIEGGITSFYIIPLISEGNSFGSITFSDNKFQASNIKELTKTERIEIENFVRLISPSIYQSLQKTIIEKAKLEVESSLKNSKKLTEMIQAIIQSTSMDDLFQKIYELLHKNYYLNSYLLYLLDKEKGELSYHRLYGYANIEESSLAILHKNIYKLSDNSSIHSKCVLLKKSFFGKNIRMPHPNKEEEEVILSIDIKSFYIIPLIMDNEVIGTIDFSNNKYENSNIKGLTKSDREEIENFVKLISPSIYQSLQKAQIEKAYQELQETQAQLVEAERMASLGQLVGGIAHEINNPIAVIRSHAELLEANNRTTLWEIPKFLETLSPTEKNIFYEIVDSSVKNRVFLNSKEERKQRKELEQELSDVVQDEDLRTTLAESIVQLRLPPPYKDYIEELGGARFTTFLSRAEVFKNQANSLSSIDIAVEKATRVIFALRNYLDTQLFSEKKEIDLVTELEKALHVYDNYVMGKINVRKEFPIELKYSCVSENLLQVWKNLFFNSIQAMYTTDKKLEISLEKWENLPDSLKSYKTSSIVEESIFQKENGKGWVVVSITDSGVGIPSELQEKVFTPFFTTKALGEGIGLGLYTCKKIVHEHGGSLFFKSEGSSTEFKVVLPA
jgi:signal transduction histidine kinase